MQRRKDTEQQTLLASAADWRVAVAPEDWGQSLGLDTLLMLKEVLRLRGSQEVRYQELVATT